MKLKLSAHGNNWERFKQRKRNKLFNKIRAKVLERDNHTCQFCKFKSQRLELINIDGDYANNKESNLAAACSLCARCTLLDRYNIEYDGGDKMIYLPELTQEKLNQLIRMLCCHMHGTSNDEIYNAKMVMAQLQDRANFLNEKATCELSHPALFVHYMGSQKSDKQLVNKLRWLPDPTGFDEEVAHWRAIVFDE